MAKKKSPKEIQQNIEAKIPQIKASLGSATEDLGYIEDTFKAGASYWEQFDDPGFGQHSELSGSAASFLQQVDVQVSDLLVSSENIADAARTLASTATTYGSITMTTSFSYPGPVSFGVTELKEVLDRRQRHEQYVRRLRAFDTELGDVYKGIWEALHRMEHAPERAALSLMRQTFDHLTRRLAPKEEVKAQPDWKPERTDKPEDPTRGQRLRFIADTYASTTTPRARDRYKASIDHIVAVYKELNKLHDDNALDPDRARGALYELQAFIENTADYVGI